MSAPPVTRQHPPQARTRRPFVLAYAAVVYLFFLLVLGYAVGFLGGAGVPRTLDRGPAAGRPAAVAIDAALLLLFAVQHSVMARPWFKRQWTRLVPPPAERATYVLFASLALALVFWGWRPVRPTIWHLTGPAAGVVVAVYFCGWALALTATFTISHFDLFGLRQAYLHARRARYRPPAFTERGLYRLVRHPLMTGFLVIFWAAPTMTAGHLLFAVASTGYILVGIWFEERDLRRDLGEAYRSYRSRVPALFPRPRSRRPGLARSAPKCADGQG
jgi:protein-S-isoprenylcysteine O-methyltransferase Ste14